VGRWTKKAGERGERAIPARGRRKLTVFAGGAVWGASSKAEDHARMLGGARNN